jgi:hypothetical protein
MLLAAVLSGCAAPQYTDVSAAGANVHFKIPVGWYRISGPDLVSAMKAEGVGYGGTWIAAYEAAPVPRVSDFMSFGTGQPFVFAEAIMSSVTVSGFVQPRPPGVGLIGR